MFMSLLMGKTEGSQRSQQALNNMCSTYLQSSVIYNSIPVVIRL